MGDIYLLKPFSAVEGRCPDCLLEFVLDVHRGAEYALCPGCGEPFCIPYIEKPAYMKAPQGLCRPAIPQIDLSQGD